MDKLKQLQQILIDRDEEWGLKPEKEAPPPRQSRYGNVNLEDAMIFPEGGAETDDMADSMDIKLVIRKKPLRTKIFYLFQTQFIIMNVIIQIIFILYTFKIGINQDKFQCFVKHGDKLP